MHVVFHGEGVDEDAEDGGCGEGGNEGVASVKGFRCAGYGGGAGGCGGGVDVD